MNNFVDIARSLILNLGSTVQVITLNVRYENLLVTSSGLVKFVAGVEDITTLVVVVVAMVVVVVVVVVVLRYLEVAVMPTKVELETVAVAAGAVVVVRFITLVVVVISLIMLVVVTIALVCILTVVVIRLVVIVLGFITVALVAVATTRIHSRYNSHRISTSSNSRTNACSSGSGICGK